MEKEYPKSSGFEEEINIEQLRLDRRIQNRVRSLEKSGDQEKAEEFITSASSINKEKNTGKIKNEINLESVLVPMTKDL
jgi:hypothetical protein